MTGRVLHSPLPFQSRDDERAVRTAKDLERITELVRGNLVVSRTFASNKLTVSRLLLDRLGFKFFPQVAIPKEVKSNRQNR